MERTVIKKPAGGGTPRTSAPEFVRGVALEMRRVTWPTREEWISATILTILLVVAIGAYTYAVDWIFGQLFQLIHPGK